MSVEWNETDGRTTEEDGRDVSNILEISYQAVVFTVGMPINIAALARHIQLFRDRSFRMKQDGRLARLSINLIIGNLLVLLHTLIKTIWLHTNEWYGGNFLCHLYTFLSTFCFHLCSNMVAAIAIDMYQCIRNPLRAQMNAQQLIRRLVGGAWGLAVLCSLPVAILKGIVEIPDQPGHFQCYMIYYDPERYLWLHLLLGASHTTTTFYIPLCVIVACYVTIGSAIRSRLHERKCISGSRATRSELSEPEMDPVVTFAADPLPKATAKRSTLPAEKTESAGQDEPAPQHAQRGSVISLTNIKGRFQSQFNGKPSLRRQNSEGFCVKRRLLKISLAIIATFVVTWLPYQVLAVWQLVCAGNDDTSCKATISKFEWLEALMLISTWINPFLYRFKLPKRQRSGERGSSAETARETSAVRSFAHAHFPRRSAPHDAPHAAQHPRLAHLARHREPASH